MLKRESRKRRLIDEAHYDGGRIEISIPAGLNMLWLMRDTGLSIFVCGSLLFVLSGIPRRIPNLPDTASLRNSGDLMMLSGACLAVTAMAFGFLASSGSP